MKIRLLLLVLTSFSFCQLFAQNTVFEAKKEINWNDAVSVYSPYEGVETRFWEFEGAVRHHAHPALPVLKMRFPVAGKGRLEVQLSNEIYEPFQQLTPTMAQDIINADWQITADVSQARRDFFGNVTVLPIRKNDSGNFERLVSFKITARYRATGFGRPPPVFANNSVLRDGKIYKIAINNSGVHQLTYDFLKNDLNIDIDNINPNHIKVLGNSGGVVPERLETAREDDLVENHIQIIGGEDNSFDQGDYLLFYAEGPNATVYNANTQLFATPINPYATQNYYFIKIDNANGERIASQPSVAAPAYTTTSFDDHARLDDDRINLLASENRSAPGTGKTWYGDAFNPTRQRAYNFDFPNRLTSEPAHISAAMALRAGYSTRYYVEVAGERFQSGTAGGVNLSDVEASVARRMSINETFTGGSQNLTVTIDYPGVNDQANVGWLDYIQLNVRRALSMAGNQMRFRDVNTVDYPNATFEVGGITNIHQVWDITDPLRPKIQEGNNVGGSFRFGVNIIADMPPKEFIAFNTQSGFLAPEAVGEIENQNLHGINDADLLVVYHNELRNAAQRFADHRRSHSNINVVMVDIDQVYNEFSSGRQDPAAIRDMVKMIFDRDEGFKYVLLFGDGSYDYRNITGESVNFIPVYETDEHLDPILGYPADDFFGLVSDEDGGGLGGDIDVAIGRIPARSNADAEGVVNKIIFYDTNPKRLGDWRNQLVFVGDDGEGNVHSRQANEIADSTYDRHKAFNIDKIFFDAFQKVPTAGGTRIPKANEAINRHAFTGNLITNYLGHGGATGWAQERVLQIEDIDSWTNTEHYPLIVTATCSFAAYDDHDIFPGGEVAIMKPDGGAIALFTTVRAVYSNSNFNLTKSVFDLILNNPNGSHPAMGEILRVAKNDANANTANTRKFAMLGDPSQKLALPTFNVGTSTINGRDVTQNSQNDTIRALEKVTITGFVYDHNDNVMTDFNGRVYPTILDKSQTIQTLGQPVNNTVNPIVSFELQKNVLFKGAATVTNGRFSFEFVVPKDIDYTYGYGKISYYAENGVSDANGYYDKIVIGGTNPDAANDDVGPLVEVFMNDENFVSGGMTDKDPTLFVKLSDDFGINIGGISIGHDLTGVLDNNTQDTYILNDFYSAELDDYTKGTVRYPLYDIPEGVHQIAVKAWDTSNNSGEGFTEFLVANSEASALRNVLNYPNPFTTSTNFQFEHLLHGQDLDVMVQIFTVSGKLVKTIEQQVFADGYRVTDVHWDGRDDYGGQLARGVYLYKIKIKGTGSNEETAHSESEFEKLVILK